MPSRPPPPLKCRRPARRWVAWLVALLGCLLGAEAWAEPMLIQQALSANSASPHFPADAAGHTVSLPDDWTESRPRHDGSVWYRIRFDVPPGTSPDALLALYVARACSNLEVDLNARRIHSGGRTTEPLTRNCHRPQLITLPVAFLRPTDNVLDLRVQGLSLQRVVARQHAAGLSELRIGPLEELSDLHDSAKFWNITMVQGIAVTLAALGLFLLGLGWMNRREAYLLHFGLLCTGWALLSARVWLRQTPWDGATIEILVTVSIPPLVAMAVQFLLSYAGRRSRIIERVLIAQCLLLPLSLWLAGPGRVFVLANAWYVLLAAQALAASGLYLWITWRQRKRDFWPMAWILGGVAALMLTELATQLRVLSIASLNVLHVALPLLLLLIGARLLQMFARALQSAEANRVSLEARVQDITAEIERNFSQLAELRVEQVTERERKRIAGDLHDDLGAKLLTIVHTSESERISTLAREALEEMRLSVRGLTGKPVRLADALADWRAEIVSRLGQASIEADWRGPTEDTEQLLSARTYVQTTRILREAVSNIIKHSGASHCKVRLMVGERDFGITVQDNGKGIPLELDGKLDRGHGMSSMKHRAKQMQGQCLVESGPGYGTVIRLTLPL
jgi:two-component system, NarL family, sensor histidine kinase UhpB